MGTTFWREGVRKELMVVAFYFPGTLLGQGRGMSCCLDGQGISFRNTWEPQHLKNISKGDS